MTASDQSGVQAAEHKALGEYAIAGAALDILFRAARTANTFIDEDLPAATVEHIYDLVKWAPSSGNTQPLRYVVVKSAAAKARLVANMLDANQAKTAKAPLSVVLAADTGFDQYMNDLLPYLENAKARFADPERRQTAAHFNATLQAGYFILGIRAAGLAAAPMLGFNRESLDQDFFPEGRYRSILVVNIGRPGPDAWMQRLPRLAADDVIRTI